MLSWLIPGPGIVGGVIAAQIIWHFVGKPICDWVSKTFKLPGAPPQA